jgi:G3E family GTPase
VARRLRGYPIGVHDPVPAHGVTACLFQARRPFHPERLHDALDEISARVQRSRGHFWLAASHPDLVMTWESAGG